MTPHSWLLYLALVTVATSTPGPAVLFIMTNATVHGWKKAVFAAAGNVTGLFCLGLMAVTGLGAIIKTSEFIFSLVKYAGSAYLIWLGVKLFFQKTTVAGHTDGRVIARTVSAGRLFFQAFGVAMSNPKAIVFLTALFPQFIDLNGALVPQFTILITTLMGLSFSFLMLYALLAHHAGGWLRRPGRVKALNRSSGALFIGLGTLLAVSSNK